MSVEEIQEKIDEVVQDIGLRLTRLGITIIYARMYAVAENEDGYVVVALPLEGTFGDSWSGVVSEPYSQGNGLVFEQTDGNGEVIIYPLGNVKEELVEQSKNSKVSAHDALLIARTQWGVE